MANNLLLVLPNLGFFLVFNVLCNFIIATTKPVPQYSINGKTKRLSTRLIHYRSIVPHPTASDYAALERRSAARLAYLNAKAKGVLPALEGADETVRSGILSGVDQNIFFVNITMGTPPIPQLAIFDTGSSLFWVQCEPCKNHKQTPNPIYDPNKSSSYNLTSCDEDYCSEIIGGSCGEGEGDGECSYNVTYGGEATSTGILGYESLTFETSYEEGKIVVSPILFGCGRDNFEPKPIPQSSGVFGISADDSSIIRSPPFKNSPKFSYCIGNYTDPDYTYSMLSLGNESMLKGQESPIEIYNGLSFVSLEGIKVGEKEIYINKDEYKFNVLVDTGTTLSQFHRSTYDIIKSEVKKILDESHESVFAGDYLCYPGNFRRDVSNFPIVTLRLANGASMELDTENIFLQLPDYFCLAMQANDDHPIIGMITHQFFNVGYDLDARKIYLQNLDCRFIDD